MKSKHSNRQIKIESTTPTGEVPTSTADLRSAYLTLLKKSLTGLIATEEFVPVNLSTPRSFVPATLLKLTSKYLPSMNMKLVHQIPIDIAARTEGRDWPSNAHTMVGLKRLENLQSCIEDIIENDVPGDLIETGVWRGGATIFMRAVLGAYGVNDRNVWVADSFEGLPSPNARAYPEDKGDTLFQQEVLRVPLEQVRANFAAYGLLDDRVRFLKGWFKDTLPSAPIQRLSLLRLDGDMYESTMDGLVHLYPKVSVGGYVIVDDYGCIPACHRAVQDYREKHRISSEIREVDWTCVYWKK